MDDLAWETLASRTSYTCEGFDVITDTVRLPDGTETEFDYVSETESVVILPFAPNGDVVVIEEWRQAVDRVNRGLPAGNLENGEAPARAAHRELAEETGYEAGTLNPLTAVEPANGFADSVFHYYVAHDCTPTADRQLDYNESIRVTTTTFDELLSDAEAGDLRDGRAMLGILYYHCFGAD
ncbi:MAG: NUDIX hydrolase [Salinirussus sp.]